MFARWHRVPAIERTAASAIFEKYLIVKNLQ
jgi:hypothetical protein